MSVRVRVLALGGTTRPESSSGSALRVAGEAAERAGATVHYLTDRSLILPIYEPDVPERSPEAEALVAAVRDADALLLASPGYHGGMSGMIKNALDYIEDLREHDRVYLDGMAVGCIAVAYGWQAAVMTLDGLRTVIHALRGWPTPLGVAVNATGPLDDTTRFQLTLVAEQVVGFARMKLAAGQAAGIAAVGDR